MVDSSNVVKAEIKNKESQHNSFNYKNKIAPWLLNKLQSLSYTHFIAWAILPMGSAGFFFFCPAQLSNPAFIKLYQNSSQGVPTTHLRFATSLLPGSMRTKASPPGFFLGLLTPKLRCPLQATSLSVVTQEEQIFPHLVKLDNCWDQSQPTCFTAGIAPRPLEPQARTATWHLEMSHCLILVWF